MPKNCGCAGESCGCAIAAGSAITVTGVGSKSNPFKISVDLANFPLAQQVKVQDTSSVDLTLTGQGTPADPLVLSGEVRLTAQNGSRYRLDVSNTGVLSAVVV
jgi:hypothetical protein